MAPRRPRVDLPRPTRGLEQQVRVQRASPERRARGEGENEGGRSAEPSGNRPRLFPGGGGGRGAGLRFQTPLSSTQRGVTCLVTPSSLLLKGRGGSLGRARGGRPGRRFAMSALRCVPPSAPGSRPQPILAPAAALCTQSHLGRSRPVGIRSEPWGTRERRPQRHGPLHSPVTAPGAEGGPPAAAGTLECERGTNASFRVGHSASGSQR